MFTVPTYREVFQDWDGDRFSFLYWNPYVESLSLTPLVQQMIPNADEFYIISSDNSNKELTVMDYFGRLRGPVYSIQQQYSCFPSLALRLICSATEHLAYLDVSDLKYIYLSNLGLPNGNPPASACTVDAASIGNRIVMRVCKVEDGFTYFSLVFLDMHFEFLVQTPFRQLLNSFSDVFYDGKSYFFAVDNSIYKINEYTDLDFFSWDVPFRTLDTSALPLLYLFDFNGRIVQVYQNVAFVEGMSFPFPGNIRTIPLSFGDYSYFLTTSTIAGEWCVVILNGEPEVPIAHGNCFPVGSTSSSSFVVDPYGHVCIFIFGGPKRCFLGSTPLTNADSLLSPLAIPASLIATGFVSPFGDIFLATGDSLLVVSARQLALTTRPRGAARLWNWDLPSGQRLVRKTFGTTCDVQGDVLHISDVTAYAVTASRGLVLWDIPNAWCSAAVGLNVRNLIHWNSATDTLLFLSITNQIRRIGLAGNIIISSNLILTLTTGYLNNTSTFYVDPYIIIVGNTGSDPMLTIVHETGNETGPFALKSLTSYCFASKTTLYFVDSDSDVYSVLLDGSVTPTSNSITVPGVTTASIEGCIPFNYQEPNQVAFFATSSPHLTVFPLIQVITGLSDLETTPQSSVVIGNKLYYIATRPSCALHVFYLDEGYYQFLTHLPLPPGDYALRYLGGMYFAAIASDRLCLVDAVTNRVVDVFIFPMLNVMVAYPIFSYRTSQGEYDLFVYSDLPQTTYRYRLIPWDAHSILPNGESQFHLSLPAGITPGNFTLQLAYPNYNHKFSPFYCNGVVYQLCGIGKLCKYSDDVPSNVNFDSLMMAVDPDCNVISAAKSGTKLQFTTYSNVLIPLAHYPVANFDDWGNNELPNYQSFFVSKNCAFLLYKVAGACSSRIWGRQNVNTVQTFGVICDYQPVTLGDYIFVKNTATMAVLVNMHTCSVGFISFAIMDPSTMIYINDGFTLHFDILALSSASYAFLNSIDSLSFSASKRAQLGIHTNAGATADQEPLAVLFDECLYIQDSSNHLLVYEAIQPSDSILIGNFTVHPAGAVRARSFWISSEYLLYVSSPTTVTARRPKSHELLWNYPFAASTGCTNGLSAFNVYPMDDKYMVYLLCDGTAHYFLISSLPTPLAPTDASHSYRTHFPLNFVPSKGGKFLPTYQWLQDPSLPDAKKLSLPPAGSYGEPQFAPLLTPGGVLVSASASAGSLQFINTATGRYVHHLQLSPYLELKCLVVTHDGKYLLVQYIQDPTSEVILRVYLHDYSAQTYAITIGEWRLKSTVTSLAVIRNGASVILLDLPTVDDMPGGLALPGSSTTLFPFSWNPSIDRVIRTRAIYLPAADTLVASIYDIGWCYQYLGNNPPFFSKYLTDNSQIVDIVAMTDSEFSLVTSIGKIYLFSLPYPTSGMALPQLDQNNGPYDLRSNVVFRGIGRFAFQDGMQIRTLTRALYQPQAFPFDCVAGSWISTDVVGDVVALCRDGSKVCRLDSENKFYCTTLYDAKYFRSNGKVSRPMFDPAGQIMYFTTENQMILGYDFVRNSIFSPNPNSRTMTDTTPYSPTLYRYVEADNVAFSISENTSTVVTEQYFVTVSTASIRVYNVENLSMISSAVSYGAIDLFASISDSGYLVTAQVDTMPAPYTTTYAVRKLPGLDYLSGYMSSILGRAISDPILDEMTHSIIALHDIDDSEYEIVRISQAFPTSRQSIDLPVPSVDKEAISFFLDARRRLVHLSVRAPSTYYKYIFSIAGQGIEEVLPRFSAGITANNLDSSVKLLPTGPFVIPYNEGILLNDNEHVVQSDDGPIAFGPKLYFVVPDGMQSDFYFLKESTMGPSPIYKLSTTQALASELDLPGFPQELMEKISYMTSHPDGTFLFVVSPVTIVAYSRAMQCVTWYYEVGRAACIDCEITRVFVGTQGMIMYTAYSNNDLNNNLVHKLTLRQTPNMFFALPRFVTAGNWRLSSNIPFLKSLRVLNQFTGPSFSSGSLRFSLFPDDTLTAYDAETGYFCVAYSDSNLNCIYSLPMSSNFLGCYKVGGTIRTVFYHSGQLQTYDGGPPQPMSLDNDNIFLTEDGHILACVGGAIVYFRYLDGVASKKVLYGPEATCPKILHFHEPSKTAFLALEIGLDLFDIVSVSAFVALGAPHLHFTWQHSDISIQYSPEGQQLWFMQGGKIYRSPHPGASVGTLNAQCSNGDILDFRVVWEDFSRRDFARPTGIVLECIDHLEYHLLDFDSTANISPKALYKLKNPLVQKEVLNSFQMLIADKESVAILSLPYFIVDFYFRPPLLGEITGAHLLDKTRLLITYSIFPPVETILFLLLGEHTDSNVAESIYGDPLTNLSNSAYISPKDATLSLKTVDLTSTIDRFHPIAFGSSLWYMNNNILFVYNMGTDGNVPMITFDSPLSNYRTSLGGLHVPGHYLHLWEESGSNFYVVDILHSQIIEHLAFPTQIFGPPVYMYRNSNQVRVFTNGCALFLAPGDELIGLPAIMHGLEVLDPSSTCSVQLNSGKRLVTPFVVQRNIGTASNPVLEDILLVAVDACPFVIVYDAYLNQIATVDCPSTSTVIIITQFSVVKEGSNVIVYFATKTHLYRLSTSSLTYKYFSRPEVEINSNLIFGAAVTEPMFVSTDGVLYKLYINDFQSQAKLAVSTPHPLLRTQDGAIWYVGANEYLYVIHGSKQVGKYPLDNRVVSGPFMLSSNTIAVASMRGLYIFSPLATSSSTPETYASYTQFPYLQRILPTYVHSSQTVHIPTISPLVWSGTFGSCTISDNRLVCFNGKYTPSLAMAANASSRSLKVLPSGDLYYCYGHKYKLVHKKGPQEISSTFQFTSGLESGICSDIVIFNGIVFIARENQVLVFRLGSTVQPSDILYEVPGDSPENTIVSVRVEFAHFNLQSMLEYLVVFRTADTRYCVARKDLNNVYSYCYVATELAYETAALYNLNTLFLGYPTGFSKAVFSTISAELESETPPSNVVAIVKGNGKDIYFALPSFLYLYNGDNNIYPHSYSYEAIQGVSPNVLAGVTNDNRLNFVNLDDLEKSVVLSILDGELYSVAGELSIAVNPQGTIWTVNGDEKYIQVYEIPRAASISCRTVGCRLDNQAKLHYGGDLLTSYVLLGSCNSIPLVRGSELLCFDTTGTSAWDLTTDETYSHPSLPEVNCSGENVHPILAIDDTMIYSCDYSLYVISDASATLLHICPGMSSIRKYFVLVSGAIVAVCAKGKVFTYFPWDNAIFTKDYDITIGTGAFVLLSSALPEQTAPVDGVTRNVIDEERLYILTGSKFLVINPLTEYVISEIPNPCESVEMSECEVLWASLHTDQSDVDLIVKDLDTGMLRLLMFRPSTGVVNAYEIAVAGPEDYIRPVRVDFKTLITYVTADIDQQMLYVGFSDIYRNSEGVIELESAYSSGAAFDLSRYYTTMPAETSCNGIPYIGRVSKVYIVLHCPDKVFFLVYDRVENDVLYDIEIPGCSTSVPSLVHLLELDEDRLLLKCNGSMHVYRVEVAPPSPSPTPSISESNTSSSTSSHTTSDSPSMSPSGTPSFTSTETLTASTTPTKIATPSVTPSVTPSSSHSNTRTPLPTVSLASTQSASPTPNPLSCEFAAGACQYPALRVNYPRIPSAWFASLDNVSKAFVAPDGTILPSGLDPNTTANQLLVSEVLHMPSFRIELPMPLALDEKVIISCKGDVPPWMTMQNQVLPLRLCVLSDSQDSDLTCVSGFPYRISAPAHPDIHVGVSVQYSSLPTYLRSTRELFGSYWQYASEQQRDLHTSTLPLPLDFDIKCSFRSEFVRPLGGTGYPNYPIDYTTPPLPVVYFPVALPMLSDIYVEQGPGLFRSSTSQTRLNLTNLMPPAPCLNEDVEDGDHGIDAVEDEEFIGCPARLSSVESILSNNVDFLDALASAPKNSKRFELTLTGETNLLLLADTTAFRTENQANEVEEDASRRLYIDDAVLYGDPNTEDVLLSAHRFFSSSTVVTIRDVPCRTNWISADGTIMSITTPSFKLLCESGDCSNLVLSISNYGFAINEPNQAKVDMHEFLISLQTITEQSHTLKFFLQSTALNNPQALASVGLRTLPIALLCPPACPQNWSNALGIATASAPSSVAPVHDIALPPVLDNGLGMPLQLDTVNTTIGRNFLLDYYASRSLQSSGYDGIQYVVQCLGDFTDPGSGECVEPKNPSSYQCSWGQHDYCKKCPIGALCPGGFRIWPRKGYWVSNERGMDGMAYPCPNPDATTRCPGWPLDCDTQDPECSYLFDQYILYGTFPCGRGYRTGSKNCAQCDTGYYPTSQGTCSACPPSTAWNTIVLPILYFFVGLLVFTGMIFLILLALVKKFGGSGPKPYNGAIQFLLWTWTSLQTVVQVTRTLEPSAPGWLHFVYSKLSALQFEGIVVHPDCLGSIPFQSQWSQYIVIGILFLLLAAFTVIMRMVASHASNTIETSAQEKDKAFMSVVGNAGEGDPKQTVSSPFGASKAVSMFLQVLHVLIPLILTILLILYATVTNSALGVLSCRESFMTIRSYFSLDGDGSTVHSQHSFSPDTWRKLQAAARDGSPQPASILELLNLPLIVSTVRIDEYHVCYESTHLPVAVVSWIVLIVYSVGYPLVALFSVRKFALRYLVTALPHIPQDLLQRYWLPYLSFSAVWSRLRGQLRDDTPSATATSASESSRESSVVIQNPLKGSRGRSTGSVQGVHIQHGSEITVVTHTASNADSGMVNAQIPLSFSESIRTSEDPGTAYRIVDRAEKVIQAHPFLKSLMTGTYRPSQYVFMQLDKLVILILGVVSSLTYRSTHVPSRVIGLIVAATATMLAAVLFHKAKPFPKLERWKLFVKIYLYLLTTFSLLVNFIMFLLDHRGSDNDSSSSRRAIITVLSILSFALCLGLFVTLVLAFLLTIIREASRNAPMRPVSEVRKSRILFRSNSLSRGYSLGSHTLSDRKLPKWLTLLMSKFYDSSPDAADASENGTRFSLGKHVYSASETDLALLPQMSQVRKNSRTLSRNFNLDTNDRGKFEADHTRNLVPLRVRSTRRN